jgi:hypothetical protein
VPFKKPSEPICQSCAYPLKTLEEKGTEATGTKCDDYCQECYQDGDFSEPEITMKDMIEKNVIITAENLDISLDKARSYLESLLPTLKRWR